MDSGFRNPPMGSWGSAMQIMMSGRDALLLAIPLIALLLVTVFRLDELFSPKGKNLWRPPARGVDEQGREILNDPDGRRCPRR